MNPNPPPQAGPSREGPQMMPDELTHQMPPQVMPPQPPIPPPPIQAAATDALAHPGHVFPFPVYATPMDVAPRAMHPPTVAPPQSWQAPNGIAPQQAHIAPPPPPTQTHIMARHSYRDDQAWNGAYQQPPPPGTIVGGPPPEYDYRYREDQSAWVPAPGYYEQTVRGTLRCVVFPDGLNSMIRPTLNMTPIWVKPGHPTLNHLQLLQLLRKRGVASVFEHRLDHRIHL